MSKRMQSNLLLLLAAIIWGSSFVAQKTGSHLGSFTFNGIRLLLSGLTLLPISVLIAAKSKKAKLSDPSSDSSQPENDKKSLFLGGILCGLALFAASTLQQFGIFFDTDAGKAGFITALYIVIVPILGVFIGKKVRPLIWICVIMGAAGFYLLTMAGKGGGFTLQKGDFLVLICAFIFSCHILLIDHFSPRCNGIQLSCIQFLLSGTLGVICMLIFEAPDPAAIRAAWFSIFYSGVMSGAMGYTLQIVGQKNADPSAASLILSLESVFAVITGVLFLHEKLTIIELIGCIVIFAAVIAAQLPNKSKPQGVLQEDDNVL